MLQNIGTTEVIIIALVILMLFGAKKIPQFVRGIVDARKEFGTSFKDSEKKESKKSEDSE